MRVALTAYPLAADAQHQSKRPDLRSLFLAGKGDALRDRRIEYVLRFPQSDPDRPARRPK
jgi:hypothetical protein